MLHPSFHAALFTLLFSALGVTACSATPDDVTTDDSTLESTDALRGRICGGVANRACPTNYECKRTSDDAHATGTCKKVDPTQTQIDAGSAAPEPSSPTSSIALAGSCWDSYACPVGSQRVWSAPVREGFELQGTKGHYLLVAREDVAGAAVGIDRLREWLKPGIVIVVDGVERGVATTVGGTEDLYARATESADGIALTVRIVPTWGSSYQNGDACTKPAASSGGYCSLTQSP